MHKKPGAEMHDIVGIDGTMTVQTRGTGWQGALTALISISRDRPRLSRDLLQTNTQCCDPNQVKCLAATQVFEWQSPGSDRRETARHSDDARCSQDLGVHQLISF